MLSPRCWLALLSSLGCGASATAPASTATDRPSTTVSGESTLDPESSCPDHGLAVLVLGSGGPILDDERASTGYVVMVDGEPRLAIDAGGGVALRMAQAGIAPEGLGGILLTHLHVDHTADLIALLKSASFSRRSDPMPLVGPSGDENFPDTDSFLEALLGSDGAWRYLGGYLRQGQPFRLEPRVIDVTGDAQTFEVAGVQVQSVGVPHGPVPALGYVVQVGDARVAFTGDQRMDDPRFLEIARGAQLLVAHHAIPEGAEGPAAALHATPAQIGALAESAEVGQLVLSHHMQRALASLEEGKRAIRSHYDGPMELASDLDCYGVRLTAPRRRFFLKL